MFLNPGKTGPLFQRSRDSQPLPVAKGSRAPRAGICGPVNGAVSWTRRRGLETARRRELAGGCPSEGHRGGVLRRWTGGAVRAGFGVRYLGSREQFRIRVIVNITGIILKHTQQQQMQ